LNSPTSTHCFPIQPTSLFHRQQYYYLSKYAQRSFTQRRHVYKVPAISIGEKWRPSLFWGKFNIIFDMKTMLTALTGTKYTSIISSERLCGCFFHLNYYFLHSIHLHSCLHYLYGNSLHSIPLQQHNYG